MYCVSGYDSISDSATSSSLSGLRRHAIGLSAPLRNALAPTLASVGWRDAVLVHVAVDLHPEELRGERQARAAVPVLAARPLDAERALLVLVEADGDAEVAGTGLDRVDRLRQRGAAGRAAVDDVGERQAGEPDPADHRVGGAAVHRAADGELHVGPLLTAVGERAAHRDDALVHARDAVVAAELVHPDSDDCDVAHDWSPFSTGANA